MDMNQLINSMLTPVAEFLPKLVGALVTLIIGWFAVNIIVKISDKALKKKKVDKTLIPFIESMLKIGLRTMLLITVISMLGVAMTSFIAIIGAAGLAVGLALQGSLANFAGGVLILIFKPFKAGEFIEAQGFSGTVDHIQIFNTILKTPDNKTIIIPNANLSNGNITNYSAESTRRVDFKFGIGYNDDIKKTKKILTDLISKDKRILKKPEPVVMVSELADSSVNITARVWAKKEDYWGIYFDLTEKVKLNFDKNKISIPYPQRDVHVFNH